MEIYTTRIDVEFSISFVNLFIGHLVQRFLVFSRKGALLHIAGQNFALQKFSIDSFPKPFPVFVEGFHTFIAVFYHLLIFRIQKFNGFHNLPILFHLYFLVIMTSFNR